MIPRSYEPLVGVLSEQFSQKPEDVDLFKGRIKQILSEDIYNNVLKVAARTFLGVLAQDSVKWPIVVDLTPMKQEVKRVLPDMIKKMPNCDNKEPIDKSFRFCKPVMAGAKQQFDKQFETSTMGAIDKAIPPNLTLDSKGNRELETAVSIIFLVKKYLMHLIIGLTVILLGFAGLIIFKPIYEVLKWIGKPLIILAVLLGSVVYVIFKLPEFMPMIFKDFSLAQAELINVLISCFSDPLKYWAIFMGVFGITLYVLGVVFKARHKADIPKKSSNRPRPAGLSN